MINSDRSFSCLYEGHMEVVEHLWSQNVAATTTDSCGARPLFAATRMVMRKLLHIYLL